LSDEFDSGTHTHVRTCKSRL